MRRKHLVAPIAVAAAGASIAVAAGATSSHPANASTFEKLNPIQQRLVSGFAALELQGGRTAEAGPLAAKPLGPPLPGGNPGNYFPNDTNNCPQTRGNNVKYNQNCLTLSDPDLQGRGQANNETFIAQDPNNPTHLVASSNDYRNGDGNCGGEYSLNGGRTWADALPPMSFTRGTPTDVSPDFGAARQYWQAGGDTSVAWDTKGNAYFSCQVFNRGGNGVTTNPDTSSALLVFRSTQNNGASWNFPGRYVTATQDNTGAVLEDKELMTVDNNLNACGPGAGMSTRQSTRCTPYQDRVYVTWTHFAADGTAYIYESHSSDYGETFSPKVLVSRSSPLCTNTFGVPTPNGPCNENQFSDPFVGPDGSLYVAYSNFNNATTHPIGGDDGGGGNGGDSATTAPSSNENYNLIFVAKSTDGGQTFSSPVLVSRYYDLPDCETYTGQDPFRACLPEKGPTDRSFFRATNYASGVVDPMRPNRVIVTFGSYINRHSNESNGCVPQGFAADGLNLYRGVRAAGACNNDILVSTSGNGGASFTGTTTDPRHLATLTPTAAQGLSDQWFQWAAINTDGRLAVGYYDRSYGPMRGGVPADEYTGYSDYSLTTTPAANLKTLDVARATTSSLPPPTEFSGLFWGDYTGISALGVVHPTWSDTRSPEVATCSSAAGVPTACFYTPDQANDQDAYTATLPFGSTGGGGGS